MTDNKTALKRLSDVIRTDATTTSKSDFLITHAPFENLSLNDQVTISERELLNEYLLSPKRRDAHKFIMVQGGNGSGKTHLIRWLKEMYEAATDPQKEAVFFISRAHNNLKDALTQLLESDYFPKEVKDRILKQLQNARGSQSVSDFKQRINFNLKLEIDNDTSQTILDRRTKAWLSRFILNPFILNTFLMCEGGPLDRLRARIETTDEKLVVDGDAPVFLPEDFAISYSQINTGLKKMDDHADDATIRMAEYLADLTQGYKRREQISSYLNTLVSAVIRSSMDLKSIDFQHVFEELRKDLKKKGMALTLFLEDINAFTGIDEALMEALLVDHTAEGNEECCRLTSVVGSTIWFYENKLNASIRERISFNVYLREGSVISEDRLDAFVARYVNAINLSAQDVEKWYESGASQSEIPLAESRYPFSEVTIDGRTYSIFPFTSNALRRLYNTLEFSDENNSLRTPRVVLTQIVYQILDRWYTSGPAFLSDEKNFDNTAFSVPLWSDETYEMANRTLSEDYTVERSLLLRIWGDGTTEFGDNSIGGVSKEIFEAFEIDFPYDSASRSSATATHTAQSAEQTTPAPAIPIAQPVDERLSKVASEINEWNNKAAPLRSHQELREDLVRFIMNNASWVEWGIPFKLAEACIQPRFITIEGQVSALVRQGYHLERNEETRYLLLALARWHYEGKNSWVFRNALDYYTIAASWLEKHMPGICAYVVRTANSSSTEELAELGVVAQYCAKVFSGGFSLGDSAEEATISLFQSPALVQAEKHNLNLWRNVSSDIQKIPELYQFSLSFFRKAIGGKKPEDAEYLFVDAFDLLKTVNRVREKAWSLDAYPLNPEKEHTLRTTFSEVISIAKSKKEDVIKEAYNQASSYITFFSREISPDLLPASISDAVASMKEFLSFLRTNNMSYSRALEDSLDKPDLDSRLVNSLKQMRSILDCTDDAGRLLLLSNTKYDDIEEIYQLFSDFDSLLDEKNKVFVSGINKTLQHEIENGLTEANDYLSTMQDLFQQLRRLDHAR